MISSLKSESSKKHELNTPWTFEIAALFYFRISPFSLCKSVETSDRLLPFSELKACRTPGGIPSDSFSNGRASCANYAPTTKRHSSCDLRTRTPLRTKHPAPVGETTTLHAGREWRVPPGRCAQTSRPQLRNGQHSYKRYQNIPTQLNELRHSAPLRTANSDRFITVHSSSLTLEVDII